MSHLMGIHSKYARTAFIFLWSTETPPSCMKESSVLLSSDEPSRYVLSATSLERSELILSFKQYSDSAARPTVVIPYWDPGKLLMARKQV